MNTVTIYRTTCTKAPMIGETGEGFALSPFGPDDEHFTGFDDGGKLYRIPDGCYVGTNVLGARMIFGPDDIGSPIWDEGGKPAILAGGRIAILEEV